MQHWFQRTFPFGLPAELLPNLLERLRGTPARLEERVFHMPAAVLTHREGNRWSPQENAGHLLDLESLWFGRIDDLTEGRERLRAADLENQKTHEARHNDGSLAAILGDFRCARGE